MSSPRARTSGLSAVIARYLALKTALGRRYAARAARPRDCSTAFLARRRRPHGRSHPDRLHPLGADPAASDADRPAQPPAHRAQSLPVSPPHRARLFRPRSRPAFPRRTSRGPPTSSRPARSRASSRRRARWPPTPQSPLRPQVFRLALVLLYTTGLRRGELLRLTVADYVARRPRPAHPRRPSSTSRAPSRCRPTPAREVDALSPGAAPTASPPVAADDAPAGAWRDRPCAATPGSASGIRCASSSRDTGIRDSRRAAPSHPRPAAHASRSMPLLRWYRQGLDVQTKLPLLATYMGHVSIVSTAYYLPFVEPLRAAGQRALRPALRRPHQARVAPTPEEARHDRVPPNALASTLRAFFTEHLPTLRGVSPAYDPQLSRQRWPCCSASSPPTTPAGRRPRCRGSHRRRSRRLPRSTSSRSATSPRPPATSGWPPSIPSARFLAAQDPAHLEQAQRLLGIPFKRARPRPIAYLEYEEIAAVLASVDRATRAGRRDYTLLATMFNTGARVQEILDLRASDLQLTKPCQVRLRGQRAEGAVVPPLAADRPSLLRAWCRERQLDLRSEARCSSISGAAPHALRRALHPGQTSPPRGRARSPRLARKKLHPHSLRHSTAVHLLKSGVDLPRSPTGWATPASTRPIAM